MAEETLRTEPAGTELAGVQPAGTESAGTEPEGLALTAGQAARQLGVAVTTLRSWHRRYGLGPTQHAPGQHRRYGADDLARLAAMRTLIGQGTPAVEAARIVLARAQSQSRLVESDSSAGPRSAGSVRDWARAAAGLLDTALRLDAERVRRLVEQAIIDHGVVTCWEQLIRPVLTEIGQRHAATGGLIEVEHLFSWTVSEAFAVVERPGEGVPARVLLACAEEEQHTLPLEALAAAAAARGVRCRQLGSRVPSAALVATVRQTRPALVVVWSHAETTADPEQLRALLADDVRPPLLAVAGPGWADPVPAGVVRLGALGEAVVLAVAAAGGTW